MSLSADIYTSAEYRLSMIPLVLQKHGITFSKTEAALLLGGKARLLRLVGQGKIRVEKPTNKQNGKWFCNAADVITNMKF